MSDQVGLNEEKQNAFLDKVLGDTSGTMSTLMAVLGDRLGLFKALAGNSACKSSDIATRTGLNERYVREWLGGMTAAGYLEYSPDTQSFRLPPEHASLLAEEGGPNFFGGFYQMLPSMVDVMDDLTEAFRNGGGVPQKAYSSHMWDGMERFTNGWFENLLTQEWLPAMPDVQRKLEEGADVADVGCGRGRALIKLAQTFPQSRFHGFDIVDAQLSKAITNAAKAGLADRIRFENVSGRGSLHGQYDIVTTFDVIHDAADPMGLLRAIRGILKPDGIYVCLDVNCSNKLEDNVGPLGAMFHGFSVFYCMTTSLAQNGVGLGTVGFHEPKVNELCKEVGFTQIRRLPLENPFNNVYEIR